MTAIFLPKLTISLATRIYVATNSVAMECTDPKYLANRAPLLVGRSNCKPRHIRISCKNRSGLQKRYRSYRGKYISRITAAGCGSIEIAGTHAGNRTV